MDKLYIIFSILLFVQGFINLPLSTTIFRSDIVSVIYFIIQILKITTPLIWLIIAIIDFLYGVPQYIFTDVSHVFTDWWVLGFLVRLFSLMISMFVKLYLPQKPSPPTGFREKVSGSSW